MPCWKTGGALLQRKKIPRGNLKPVSVDRSTDLGLSDSDTITSRSVHLLHAEFWAANDGINFLPQTKVDVATLLVDLPELTHATGGFHDLLIQLLSGISATQQGHETEAEQYDGGWTVGVHKAEEQSALQDLQHPHTARRQFERRRKIVHGAPVVTEDIAQLIAFHEVEIVRL